jgi:hypothetical protein
MFTSLAPITHRVVKNGRQLQPSLETLAERFGAAGWDTAGFVSSYVLDSRFGWDQGFAHWDDEFEPGTATAMVPAESGPEAFDRRATETTRRTLAWVEREWQRDRPFFVFVHYMDPLVWIATVTTTPALQKIFSTDAKLGFFAAANAMSDQLLAGTMAPERAAVAPALIFNQRLDGWLAVMFLIIMWIVIIEMLRISVRYLHGKPVPPSSETPYVPTQLDASALPRAH